MNHIVKSIEEAYCDFCSRQKNFLGSCSSEFLGINLNNNLSIPISFKRYYRAPQNIVDMNKFIKNLNARNMLHAVNFIDDTLYCSDSIRYEIALTHRTNENMDWLFKELKKILPDTINKNMNHIVSALSDISITSDANYKKAAIFFIGFIEKVELLGLSRIDVFKLYYILRNCSSPDSIGKNFTTDNVIFLNKLEYSGLTPFIKLTSIIRPLVNNFECDLWLSAIDFTSNNMMKYKIYIKKCKQTIYSKLAKNFLAIGETFLSQQILGYGEWISQHPELEQYGLAVCVDSNSVLTINLYH